MSLFSLKDKVAVITGGASGIGRAISQKLADQGAEVHILEFNKQEGVKAIDEIKNGGGNAHFHHCDVGEPSQVIETIEALATNCLIHILINNAGVAHIGNIEATETEDMDRLIRVNIKGVFNITKAVIPHMKKNNSGVVINMASIASTVALADRFAYAMTKGAVLTMTYSIAKDYLDFGIRCNCISPSRVHTPFVDNFLAKNYPGEEKQMFDKLSKTQPIGRMGKPEEIANLALYLCSDEASFITGTDFPIDGGFIKLQG